MPFISVSAADLESTPIVDAFVQTGLTASKGEARRLIAQNGAKMNDAAIADATAKFTAADVKNGVIKLSAGKKKHALVKVDG